MLYLSLPWGSGPGLLQCQVCGALVVPGPTDLHRDWHEWNGDDLSDFTTQ